MKFEGWKVTNDFEFIRNIRGTSYNGALDGEGWLQLLSNNVGRVYNHECCSIINCQRKSEVGSHVEVFGNRVSYVGIIPMCHYHNNLKESLGIKHNGENTKINNEYLTVRKQRDFYLWAAPDWRATLMKVAEEMYISKLDIDIKHNMVFRLDRENFHLYIDEEDYSICKKPPLVQMLNLGN